MGKIAETRQLYKEMISEISKDETSWRDFLGSSSWNFKYDFDDQILIYAQKPDARACASMEEWNKKLRRWVNRNTKPIYVFDKNPYSEYPFRLVFDISDTHNSSNTEYKLWTVKPEYEQDIIEGLEANFGDISSKESLAQAITLASYNMVVDNIEDYLSNIIKNKKGSMLENMSDNEIRTAVTTTAWASVSYMMIERCGLNAKEQVNLNEFLYIKYFNTQEVLTTLGASVSDIAETGLREIARTITTLQKSENLKNRTIEKIDKELYSDVKEKNEGGIEDGGNQIRETGRILYSKSSDGERENSSREVRIDEIQLSKKSQELRTDNINNEQETERTSNRDTGNSNKESKRDSIEFGETGWNDRRIESQRPVEVGKSNEQLQDDSRGDSSERINLYLGSNSQRRFITKEEQKSNKDFLQDKYTSAILANIQNLRVTRTEIKEFYKQHQDINERAQYIKQAFNDAYTEIVVDDNRLGYKTYENVLHLWKDNYLNRTAEVYYDWERVAEYIEGMIIVNEFNDIHKPIPSFTDQMQILSMIEADNEQTIFTQEAIDTALQSGSHFADGKYRIYNQFEQSLSSEANIKFLKHEYGDGASSSIHIGTNIGIEFNAKGVTLYRGYGDDNQKLFLTWNKVEKRIGELIKLDRYLNSKEKEEYSKWQERQEKQLKESKQQILEETKKAEDDKEQKLAERLHDFIRDFDFYNYMDNTEIYRTESDNIAVIKADISDKMNVKDYVNALKSIIEDATLDSEQLTEAKELLAILESRVPKYEYRLGDKIYIGADEYEFAGINNNIVTLYDTKFPLINKQMEFEEFERKVRENYSNDHLIVKDKSNEVIKLPVTEKVEKLTPKIDNTLKEENIDIVDTNSKVEIIEEIKPTFTKRSNKIQTFDLHPEIKESERLNYKITDNDLGIGTPREKFENNIQAIKVLKRCEQENRYATKEEQEILSKYVGWRWITRGIR